MFIVLHPFISKCIKTNIKRNKGETKFDTERKVIFEFDSQNVFRFVWINRHSCNSECDVCFYRSYRYLIPNSSVSV